MTLTEFLLARIAEDEVVARERPPHYAPFEREWEWCPEARSEPLGDLGGPGDGCTCGVDTWKPSAHVLAECKAKRRIVNAHRAGFPDEDRYAMGWHDMHVWSLYQMAAVYADHPDYQQEWAL